MQMTIPWPPSVNHYWRKWRNRMVVSKEGRAFRRNVQALLGGSGKPPTEDRIALAMDAFPPDRRRRDLDNLQKAVCDALQHAGVYEDDCQIDLLIIRRCALDRPDGHVEILIMAFPLRRCPLCGGSIGPGGRAHA